MPITELPTTAPTSLGPDKIDKRVYAGEPYKFQAFLVNKIRQYLIDIGGTVGLSNGTTPGSVIARLFALEAGAAALRETGGPTTLTLGSIPDGTFLRRVGSTVIGAAGSGSSDAQSLWTRPINNAVAPTAGQILSYNAVDNRWDYTDPATNASMFTFAPGAPTPGPGVHTTWTTLSAALAAARALYPSLTLTVLVDSVAVGYVVDVPSGSYDWDNVTFESSYTVFNFKAGAVVTAFDGVEFNGITLTTDATTGSPAFTAYGPGSTVNTLTFREASGLTDGGAGTIPVMRSVAGVGGLYFIFTGGAGMYQSGPSAPAVVDANGGPLYFYLEDNTYIESRCVGNAVGTPVALVMYASPSADHSGASSFALVHPLWTAGTVTVQMFSEGRRVAFTPDGNITETNVQDAVVGVRNRTATRSFYFAPGKGVPAANEITTWTALQTALTAAGADTIKHVYVDGSSVAYNISIPAGTYVWNETKFHGDDSVFVFQTGAVVSDFYGVTFHRISVMTAATTGLSPMTCPAGYGRPVTFVGLCNLYSSAPGEIPVLDIPTGAGGVTLTLQEGATVNGNGASAPVRVTGTSLYVYTFEDSSVDARGIMSSNAGSTVYFYVIDPAGQTKTGTSFLAARPLWTAGTVNPVLRSIAENVTVTPSGNIAATNVGAALSELDTEKASVSGGQLGGTGAAPTVLGVRETSGPTLLAMGAVADGQLLTRSGTTLVGTDVPQVLWQWNRTDLSQFTQVGIAGQWSLAYSATAAPGANPAIVATTLVPSATVGYLLLPTTIDLTKPYIVEATFGPYTGNNVATERVRPDLLFHYFDSANYCYVSMQANNVNGNGAVTRNLEVNQTVANVPTYSQPNDFYTPTARVKGVVRVQCVPSPTANVIETGIETARNRAWYELTANNLASPSARLGVRFVHYGASQTTGDNGYIYGLRVLRAGGA